MHARTKSCVRARNHACAKPCVHNSADDVTASITCCAVPHCWHGSQSLAVSAAMLYMLKEPAGMMMMYCTATVVLHCTDCASAVVLHQALLASQQPVRVHHWNASLVRSCDLHTREAGHIRRKCTEIGNHSTPAQLRPGCVVVSRTAS
jgi:hypothetical protein